MFAKSKWFICILSKRQNKHTENCTYSLNSILIEFEYSGSYQYARKAVNSFTAVNSKQNHKQITEFRGINQF